MRTMTALRRAAVLAFAAIAAGCATLPSPDPGTEVETTVRAFVRSISDADLDAFLSFFEPDASVFFPSPENGARLTGLPAIRRAAEPALRQKPFRSMAIRDLVITRSDELAVASFEVGSETVHSRRTLVLRRRRGAWWIVHLHASNLRPPEASSAP